jgi:hypothetical protein
LFGYGKRPNIVAGNHYMLGLKYGPFSAMAKMPTLAL